MRKRPTRARDALRKNQARLVLSAFALAIAFPSWDAAAQEGPIAPFNVRLGALLGRDSNVFRVPNDVSDPQGFRGISGKSDTFRTVFGGLDFDKTYSRQRITAGITKTETRYDKFTSLDRDLLDYNGKLQWEVGSRVRGVLAYAHAEDVVQFEDQQGLRFLNKRTTDTGTANIVVEVHPRWHLLGGLYESRTRTTQVNLSQPASDINTEEIGLRHVTGSDNSVTLMRRSRRGQNVLPSGFINVLARIDTDFTDEEIELQATWRPSGKSALNGRLTWLERKNPHFPERDFSGTAGELAYLWLPTGKLSVSLVASRNIVPWTADLQASYRIDDSLIFRPVWQVSDKVRLSLNPSLVVSDFRGPVVLPPGIPLRHDTVRAVTFAAEWSPYEFVQVVATLEHSQRKSNLPNLDFSDNIATLKASLRF